MLYIQRFCDVSAFNISLFDFVPRLPGTYQWLLNLSIYIYTYDKYWYYCKAIVLNFIHVVKDRSDIKSTWYVPRVVGHTRWDLSNNLGGNNASAWKTQSTIPRSYNFTRVYTN